MQWFISMWDVEAGLYYYRGGETSDRETLLAAIVVAGRSIARPVEGLFNGHLGTVVIGRTQIDGVPFGDFDISDQSLRRLVRTRFDDLSKR